MKTLSLTQPFAALIACGAKRIETRSWTTTYRGPLAIHAAKGLPRGGLRNLKQLCNVDPFRQVLFEQWWPHSITGGCVDPTSLAKTLPRGAIVAVCELITIVPTRQLEDMSLIMVEEHRWELTDQERAFGDYSHGRYAWLLDNLRVLPEPIPAKGALGLWEWKGHQ